MKHLILGAGPAGVVAAETLRKLDPSAAITLVGDEAEPPYSRMAIPYLLRDDIDERGTYLRKRQDYFAAQNIDVRVDRAVSVEAQSKQARLSSGASFAYDKLLIATGARPITPPIPGLEHPKVRTCWTLQDARAIAAGVAPGASVVLIGAGFIGCIILEALASIGAKITVIEMGERMVVRMLDETCGALLQTWCEQKGIAVRTASVVASIDADSDADSDGDKAGQRLAVRMEGGDVVMADFVISAVGVRPAADFLQGSGVRLENGAVRVDEFMAASQADIFAAGDVACGKDFSSGGYSVQAIQPTAVEHARIAAHNMHRSRSIKHHGAVPMNVLDTIGLISASYGLWAGVDGGDSCERLDARRFRYIRLRFADDRLVGANTLGLTQHIGVIRGLIQGRFALGKWKRRLMANPLLLMEAYLAATQG